MVGDDAQCLRRFANDANKMLTECTGPPETLLEELLKFVNTKNTEPRKKQKKAHIKDTVKENIQTENTKNTEPIKKQKKAQIKDPINENLLAENVSILKHIGPAAEGITVTTSQSTQTEIQDNEVVTQVPGKLSPIVLVFR